MKGFLFITDDGSHSIHSEQFGVSYHSRHGAIQETQHVFIERALLFKAQAQQQLQLLEIGFGTGLNALMSLMAAEQHQLQLHYTSIEAYPIPVEQAKTLNFCAQLQSPQFEDHFLQMHQCAWEQPHPLHPNFTFLKSQQHFEALRYQQTFDIIYFDAFAPNAQPELWERPMLQKMYDALRPGGVLTTYCAKGVVKRILKAIGFELESLPGPPGKREMTRVIRPE
ncbi:MAG: tRNA (5-methylaminomethyl-2-thiouridine)(34)-methyltransferase MnmD [Bacteroidota bacterium]